MLYKVEDLQIRFREHGLHKHWLVPSLSPLMKILIYEYRNKCEELIRKGGSYSQNLLSNRYYLDTEHSLAIRRLTSQVADLEMKIDNQHDRLEAEQTNPRIFADDIHLGNQLQVINCRISG
jgi:hypothetical protein